MGSRLTLHYNLNMQSFALGFYSKRRLFLAQMGSRFTLHCVLNMQSFALGFHCKLQLFRLAVKEARTYLEICADVCRDYPDSRQAYTGKSAMLEGQGTVSIMLMCSEECGLKSGVQSDTNHH